MCVGVGLITGTILNVYQIYPIPGLEYINRFFTPLIYRVFVKILHPPKIRDWFLMSWWFGIF